MSCLITFIQYLFILSLPLVGLVMVIGDHHTCEYAFFPATVAIVSVFVMAAKKMAHDSF